MSFRQGTRLDFRQLLPEEFLSSNANAVLAAYELGDLNLQDLQKLAVEILPFCGKVLKSPIDKGLLEDFITDSIIQLNETEPEVSARLTERISALSAKHLALQIANLSH